ncbi:FAD-dependent monooxygenase [Kocuria sp. cx-455]|uniref:FAD-dependent monooxygenase n=1 Tax=Kocuria sp. cx-455 TaxID=2771377 RepID=UPI003D76569B
MESESRSRNGAQEHQQVIVVGAGPIGLTAALWLADAGIHTTVVEKATEPGDQPRAISLQDESFRTFDRLGIADALKAESLLDTGSRYLGLGGTLLAEAKPVPSRIGHPAKTQFDQPILEQLLFDRAVQHTHLNFMLGTEAIGLSQDTDGVTLEVSSSDGTRTLSAPWLIGADGGRSFTRSALGIKLEGTTQPQRWIVIDLLNEQVERDPFAEFHCDGKRPYVLVPGINGRLRLEYMLFDNEDADAMTTPDKIRELVRAFRTELADEDVRRAAVYVAHQRIAENYRSGRAFLVGDAAHLMPPFAGQGLNAGIRDAGNIAWKLIDAIKGGATDRLLNSYNTERRTHGAQMVKVSQRIGAVVMATHPVGTRVRDKLVRLLRKAPAVHNYLANMRFISPPDYSDGVAAPLEGGSPLPEVPVGRALSQPQVRPLKKDLIHSAATGLDDYLGPGWAVIGIGAEAEPENLSPYFTALGAARVHLHGSTESAAPRGGQNVTHVVETEPSLTRGHHGEPVYVLVRPDRYVAAVFTAAQQAEVVDHLRTFIDDRSRSARGKTA